MPKTTANRENKGMVLLERHIQQLQPALKPSAPDAKEEPMCRCCYQAFVTVYGPCKHLQRPEAPASDGQPFKPLRKHIVQKYVVTVQLPDTKDDLGSHTEIVKAESGVQAERVGKRKIWDHMVQRNLKTTQTLHPELASFESFLKTYDDWVKGAELNELQRGAEERDAVEFEQLVECVQNVVVYELGALLKGTAL